MYTNTQKQAKLAVLFEVISETGAVAATMNATYDAVVDKIQSEAPTVDLAILGEIRGILDQVSTDVTMFICQRMGEIYSDEELDYMVDMCNHPIGRSMMSKQSAIMAPVQGHMFEKLGAIQSQIAGVIMRAGVVNERVIAASNGGSTPPAMLN